MSDIDDLPIKRDILNGQSESIGKLVEALSKVQGSLPPVTKSSDNPFFKSKYADLASVWDACRGPLAENGLAVIQVCVPTSAPNKLALKTILAHSSGEWISGVIEMTPVKQDPQAAGSAITYARRYGLQAIVGIAPEDDDGNEASHGGPKGFTEKEVVWPGEGQPRRPFPKGSPEYQAKVERNKDESRYSPLAVTLSDDINKSLEDDERPAFLGDPETTPKQRQEAWSKHFDGIDRGDFQKQLEEIPAQVTAKIESEKPKDSLSMFKGTCKCGAVLVTATSEGSKYPGRPYIACHQALQDRAKLLKQGKTMKEAQTLTAGHYREWAGPWPMAGPKATV